MLDESEVLSVSDFPYTDKWRRLPPVYRFLVNVDTSSPSPRLYRLIAHKFKLTRGPSRRSVKTRGTDPPRCVLSAHHNHTREDLPGSPPRIGVVCLVDSSTSIVTP